MLRYKGKSDRESNKQVDLIPDLCTCVFVDIGMSMNNHGCKVHPKSYYPCDHCLCVDYRPKAVKTSPGHWPTCVCGHVVQEHN